MGRCRRSLLIFRCPCQLRRGLEEIRKDIPAEWGRWVDVERGWWAIVIDLHQGLRAIVERHGLSEKFKVYQVKQKFGELRFYFDLGGDKTPEVWNEMGTIVKAACHRAATTCERCGTSPATLCRRDGSIQTVCVRCRRRHGFEAIVS